MHPKATQALKKRLEELVNNFHYDGNSFSSGFFSFLVGISTEIHKHKREWISLNEISQLIYGEILSRIDNNKNNAALSQKISPTDFSSHILSIIDSIPKPYTVTFSLPGIDAKIPFDFEISETVSFKTISDLDYLPHYTSLLGGLPAAKQIACIQISTQGYFGPLMAGESLHHPTTLFKVFIERCLFGGLLDLSYIFTTFHSLSPLVGAQDDNTKSIREISLKSSDKNFVRRVLFRQSPLQLKLPQKEQRRYIFSLMGSCRLLLASQSDNAKRVLAASEWRYEALAEESPAMSLVKTCVGLEAIFGEQNSEGGITSSLADRCAFSLANNHRERATIIEKTKCLYRWRSKIVHGTASRLDHDGDELLEYGIALLGAAISNEIKMLSP